jgi:hypothetical protein
MPPDTGYLWNKRCETLMLVQLSVLYHQKRERFFDLLDKLTKAVSVFGGSAALWKLSSPQVIAWAAALITATATFSLVGGFAERARKHADLARSFRLLEGDIVGAGERDYTEAGINAWQARLRGLEASEPPALGALVIACQNELAVAAGQRDKVVYIPWPRRLLMNFIDWNRAAA